MDLLAGILATVIGSISLSLSEAPHPRLLLAEDGESAVAEAVASSDHLGTIESMVYEAADNAVLSEPTMYVKNGRRLLDQSRRSLGRLFALSYAYRFYDCRVSYISRQIKPQLDRSEPHSIMLQSKPQIDSSGLHSPQPGEQKCLHGSQKEKYLSAAIAELNSVCSFPDWNPSHYLDVAEMCLGVAIAYDWLYDVLPEEIRDKAAEAIEHLAIDTALNPQYNGFYNGVSNWLQVCNAGLVFGALAIADKVPGKALQIIENYRTSITRTVDSYDPDGAYLEGPGYWAYGTDFNSLLNFQLEMSGIEPYTGAGGFVRTGDYFLHATGPTGLMFNYSDCGKKAETSVSEFYFAHLQSRPELLWNCLRYGIAPDRLLPATIIFGSIIPGSLSCEPDALTWYGRGKTPVFFARTSWNDPDALYFGVKGGSASVSHSHLDQGSFVFDALGERWIIDLGNENYTPIEKAGVKLWNMSQDSPRWNLMAYNNLHHSTMSFDSMHQRVDGKAEIVKTVSKPRCKGAVIDLSECYDNVKSVTRGIFLRGDRAKYEIRFDDGDMYVDRNFSSAARGPENEIVRDKNSIGWTLEITDCVRTCENSVEMEWNLMTSFDTECSVEENGDILLRRNGKSLRIEFVSSNCLSLQSRVEECVPQTSYESIRAKRVGFTVQLPPRTKSRFKIVLMPQS